MPVHFDSIEEGLLEIVKKLGIHPKHIFVIHTNDNNPFCRASMLEKIVTSAYAHAVFGFAGITCYKPNDDNNALCIGHTEVLQDYNRKRLAKATETKDMALISYQLCEDFTVVVPAAEGLILEHSFTDKYVPFCKSLRKGDLVRCIINGVGFVTNIPRECDRNVLTVEGSHFGRREWSRYYSDDGTNLYQQFAGRTLRPLQ